MNIIISYVKLYFFFCNYLPVFLCRLHLYIYLYLNYQKVQVNLGFTKDSSGNHSFVRSVAAGALSGCMGAVVGSPFYMVNNINFTMLFLGSLFFFCMFDFECVYILIFFF